MANTQSFQQKVRNFMGTLFYLSYAPYAYLYSKKRDRLERQFLESPTGQLENPGRLVNAEKHDRGAYFYFEQASLEVAFLTPDLVRLTWQPGLLPIPYGIAHDEWSDVTPQLESTPGGWVVSIDATDALRVEVEIDGSIRFLEASKALIREELPPQRQGDRWVHQARLQPEAAVYGLGERAVPLNLRLARETTEKGEVTATPKTFRMWNYDAAGKYDAGADPLYLCIPLYLTLHHQGSYLVFYENSFEAKFQFQEVATADFSGGALRYYVTTGSVPQLVERYTELTGRAPLPPKWALGYHQSHWGYNTEEAVRQEYQNFEKHNLPLSAIHLDIDVQVGYRAFTIDPDRFPKLGDFIKEMANHGVRFITILNPGIRYSRQSNLFLEGQILDAFCKLPDGRLLTGPVWPGWCVFPDFTKPEVRRWWSQQYPYLLDVGVAGFWHDMNEPAAFILWGDRSLPKITRHYMEGRGGDHREAHNVYGLLQAKAGYESLCRFRPEQRPFIVSRAGWAGLQRYAWTWTGDIECTWKALKQTISTVVGLGLSGVPYSGPDVGGFQGNPDAELYLRWFQMSTFLTFFRTHSSNNVDHRTPWLYGEPTLSLCRKFLQLRYQLLPYFYTLAWEAKQTGYAPVRPVFWLNQEDSTLWSIDDQFLLGDRLMICPITEDGSRSRQVRLPLGQWYHFWDDAIFQGPGQVELAAPLEQIPVLVKAGAILPLEDKQKLTLHLYPPTVGSSQAALYLDAGDGYGDSRLERFQISRDEQGLDFRWETEGNFPFPYPQIVLHLHGVTLQQVWIDGTEVDSQENCVSCDRPFQQARLNCIFR